MFGVDRRFSNKRMACRRHCTEMNVNVQNVLKNKRISGYTRDPLLVALARRLGQAEFFEIYRAHFAKKSEQ